MADMNVNYINPFLEAAIAIVKDACQVELKIGKPYAKMVELTEGTVVILNKETTAPVTTQEHSSKEQETSSVQTTQAATEATTKAAVGRSLKLSGTAEVQDNTSSDHYKNAMFIGDFVISGISGFGFASDSQVIASNSMTSDKLSGYMDEFVSNSPDSVYIMVGINDLNYGSRSVEDIYNYEKSFIEELKSKLPDTDVYVL